MASVKKIAKKFLQIFKNDKTMKFCKKCHKRILKYVCVLVFCLMSTKVLGAASIRRIRK